MTPLLTLIQWTPMRDVILLLYFSVLIVLSLYGLHRYVMLYLYFRHKHVLPGPMRESGNPPRVTIQLPVFNEMNVAGRLIDAVCAIDYPADRLQIQVLDDSTDETSRLVGEAVERHRSTGIDVQQIRRDNRRGFKAGALDNGLSEATGEFIAVFDADFIPRTEFLKEVMPHFADPAIGMVQTRWDHLNRDYSLLTRVQSLLLDGHFVIEHAARNASGRFFNFNGTAGVWRRSAIEAAGGWQHDTVTEDLDLSYRAQIAGWRFVYLKDSTAPAELPIEMDGFKSQQHRWAKGSVQTARKLLGDIFRSSFSLSIKAEAFAHLTANFGYPLMLLLALLIFPAMMIRTGTAGWWLLAIDVPLFLLSTASVSAFYFASQREIGRGFWKTLPILPALMAIGIGLSVNNARAVFSGLFSRGGDFARTPKHNVTGQNAPSLRKRYRGQRSPAVFFEVAIALYLCAAVLLAVHWSRWAAIPFLVIFCWGFCFTAVLSIRQRLIPSSAFGGD